MAALCSITLGSNFAFAESASQGYNISLSIEPKCNVVTPNIDFGTIYLTGNKHHYEATNTILLTCIKNTPYKIEIDAGNSGSLAKGRLLQNKENGDSISYNLYTSENQIWGNDLNGTISYHGVGTGTQEQIPLKARIYANQSVYPGFYNDTLILTVNY